MTAKHNDLSSGAGEWRPILGGGRAFFPHPLPPDFPLDMSMLKAVAAADHVLGRLAEAGSRLPNPHLLIRPFIAAEAVASSKIEGTRTTLGELLSASAGAIPPERAPEDLREVSNYVRALDYGVARLTQLPLSLRLIREVHGKLMEGVEGQEKTPGEFRKIQNWIGPPGRGIEGAAYVPPPPDALPSLLKDFERFMHDDSTPAVVQAGMLHWQFEAIHPFMDGNGRVGRLLCTLFLCERGAITGPTLYPSAFFEATREEYYDRLEAVSLKGDWRGWLDYFVQGITVQAVDALKRTQEIVALGEKWTRELNKRGLRSAHEITPHLLANPYITLPVIQEKMGVSYNTVASAVGKLVEAREIEQVGGKERNRVYCAKALLAILERPPTLRADVLPDLGIRSMSETESRQQSDAIDRKKTGYKR